MGKPREKASESTIIADFLAEFPCDSMDSWLYESAKWKLAIFGLIGYPSVKIVPEARSGSRCEFY
jgi:hypothetical protein